MPKTTPSENTGFTMEVTTGDKISGSDLATITDIFKETFANPPYGQFLVYPSVGKPISAQAVFGEDKKYIASKELDSFDLKDFPKHPETGEAVTYWMNPEIVYENLRRKFRENLHIALFRNNQTQSIAGVNYGYFATVAEAFALEEWNNPLLYSGINNPDLNRDFGKSMETLQKLFRGWMEIREDTRVFVLSCTLLLPEARGGDNVMQFTKAMMNSIPAELRNTRMLHELMTGSYAHFFVKAVSGIHGVELPNFFGDNHQLTVTHLGEFINQLNLPADQVSRRIKNVIASRKKGYIPNTEDYPDVEVKSIDGKGRGVFAKNDIPVGTTIAVFKGPEYTVDKISELHNEPPVFLRDRVIQVGEKKYIHGADGLAELLNHSCEPNCGLGDEVSIVTMREIKAGEELTWDYGMSEDSDWRMDGCKCGALNCRGSVTSYRDLPTKKKREYNQFASPWLKDKYPM